MSLKYLLVLLVLLVSQVKIVLTVEVFLIIALVYIHANCQIIV